MTKYIIFIFLILAPTSLIANNDVGIFFKIAVDNATYTSLTVSKPERLDKKFKFISRKIRNDTFDISQVSPLYYKITVHKNITFLNYNIEIYELTPKFNDRFKQVIWAKDKLIIRKEVYSTNNKLMLVYGYVDNLPEIISKEKSYPELKYLPDYKVQYKGFKITMVRKVKKNILHIMFSDGLNSFSIFIQKSFENALKPQTEKESVFMGNNIYQKRINNELFTVVGTIPFMEMKKIIPYIKEITEENTK